MLKYICLPFNPLQVNTWIIYEENGECVIIDPSCSTHQEEAELSDKIQQLGVTPVKVLLTHGHFDHLAGVSFTTAEYDIPLCGSRAENDLLHSAADQSAVFGFDWDLNGIRVDSGIDESDQIKIGNSVLQVLAVPGHSPGSLAYYAPEEKFVVVGDVLFAGGIGRTDLPGGDYNTLINSIRNNLFKLVDEVAVLPGHGPSTTIGQEKTGNPFFT